MVDETSILRPSQYLYTFGVGSILQTANGSRIIPEISKWDHRVAIKKEVYISSDNEIQCAYFTVLKDFNNAKIFRIPTSEKYTNGKLITPIISTLKFPQWVFCDKENCNKDRGKLIYQDDGVGKCICGGFNSKNNIRFVKVCPAGHLGDLDWHKLLHTISREDDFENTQRQEIENCDYFVFEWDSSKGSGVDDIGIECKGCSVRKKMSDFYRMRHVCDGIYQEKRNRALGCLHPPSIKLKNSGSMRYPELLSFIIVPPFSTKLHELILGFTDGLRRTAKRLKRGKIEEKDVWDNFKEDLEESYEVDGNWIDKRAEIIFNDMVKSEGDARKKKKYEKILEDCLDKVKDEKRTETMFSNKLKEFRYILQAVSDTSRTLGSDDNEFFEVDYGNIIDRNYNGLDMKVVPVNILKAVTVQAGYKRFPRGDTFGCHPDAPCNTEEHSDQAVDVVQTFYEDDSGSKWYAGMEEIGEGVFISIDNLDEYLRHGRRDERSKEYKYRTKQLNDGNVGRSEKSESQKVLESFMESDPNFEFIHSLSHRVLDSLSVDSGYNTAAIRERIYVDIETGHAGILLYVHQPGSDGSLGGITSVINSSNFDRLMGYAELKVLSCSNGPLCVKGCFACLYVSETSCEMRNKHLNKEILKDFWSKGGK